MHFSKRRFHARRGPFANSCCAIAQTPRRGWTQRSPITSRAKHPRKVYSYVRRVHKRTPHSPVSPCTRFYAIVRVVQGGNCSRCGGIKFPRDTRGNAGIFYTRLDFQSNRLSAGDCKFNGKLLTELMGSRRLRSADEFPFAETNIGRG